MKPDSITLEFHFIEGGHKVKQYKTLAGARRAAQYQLGDHPTVSERGGYAVDDYGCCTLRVAGCTFGDLFPSR